MQNFKTEIDNLKKRFEEKRQEIQALFRSDLSESKQKCENQIEYLQHVFHKIENIVEMKILQKFNQYFLNVLNIPIQINLKFLKYDQFIKLLDLWIQSTSNLLQSSQNLKREHQAQHYFRNKKISQIIKTKSESIIEYAQILSPHQRFSDYDFNLLLRQLFMNTFLYEFKSDTQTFFDKVNSFDSLMNLLSKYRVSQNKNTLNDLKFIYINEIPNFFKFWQQINSQLILEQEVRKNVSNVQTQTEQILEQNSKQNHFQKIVNEVNKLNQLKKQNNTHQIIQQIDRIISLLNSQRNIIFHKHNQFDRIIAPEVKISSRKGSLPSLAQVSLNKKSANQKEIQNMLHQIYSYYSNNELQFENQVLREPKSQVFDSKKLLNFLSDAGILGKLDENRIATMIQNILSNPNQVQFHEFFKFVQQLILLEPQLNISIVQKFTEINTKKILHKIEIKPRRILTGIYDNNVDRMNQKKNNYPRLKQNISLVNISQNIVTSKQGNDLKKYRKNDTQYPTKLIQNSLPIISRKRANMIRNNQNENYSNLGYKNQ